MTEACYVQKEVGDVVAISGWPMSDEFEIVAINGEEAWVRGRKVRVSSVAPLDRLRWLRAGESKPHWDDGAVGD